MRLNHRGKVWGFKKKSKPDFSNLGFRTAFFKISANQHKFTDKKGQSFCGFFNILLLCLELKNI